MELFSEVYSCYYQVVAKILHSAKHLPLSYHEMAQIVEENAFSESGLYILPRLMEGEWPLIEKTEDGWISKIKSIPAMPLTNLQKSWIAAIIKDHRIHLFLEEEQLKELEQVLEGVTPLFLQEDFYDFDTYCDGDNYENPEYQKRFRIILKALREKQTICITFQSRTGKITKADYLPCKLEYSRKDDKFRLYAALIKGSCFIAMNIINLGRIIDILPSREVYTKEIDMKRFFENNHCHEPVCLQIFPRRNAVERCMLHFASYEKKTEYDEATDTYICTIYYNLNDETELLIRVLSFGPVVKVLGPPAFLNLVKERVLRQYHLIHDVK